MVQFDVDGSGSLDLHEFIVMIAKSDTFKFKLQNNEKEQLLSAALKRNGGLLIQGAVRGKQVRDFVAQRKHAEQFEQDRVQACIQAAAKGKMSRIQIQRERQETTTKSALVIQSAMTQKMLKESTAAVDTAARVLQRNMRAHCIKLTIKQTNAAQQTNATQCIQGAMRGKKARRRVHVQKRYAALKSAASVNQMVEGKLVRQRVQTLLQAGQADAATSICALVQGKTARRQVNMKQEATKASALSQIQRAVMGFKTKQMVCGQKCDGMTDAAAVIRAAVYGQLARQAARDLEFACICALETELVLLLTTEAFSCIIL